MKNGCAAACGDLKTMTNRVALLERDFGKLLAEFRETIQHAIGLHKSYRDEIDRVMKLLKFVEGKHG